MLKVTPGMDIPIATFEGQIRGVSNDINQNCMISQFQTVVDKLSAVEIPNLTSTIKVEGSAARDKIEESMQAILNELKTDQSICRIKANILPSAESITWYGETNPRPPFAIWFPDDPVSKPPA